MKLGSRNRKLPAVPTKELLALPGVYGVKKIEIHKDFDYLQGQNDLAILTLEKSITFDSETKKGELQTKHKSYRIKSKVHTVKLGEVYG